MTTQNIFRVSKSNPCQVCGKHDWCRILADGTPVCARIPGDIKYDNGGWIHRKNIDTSFKLPAIKSTKQSKNASIEVRNKTYSQLLFNLPLSERHKENLLKRGLTEAQISNYGTMPQYNREYIIRNLQKLNIQLQGVPGFYTDINGRWLLAGPTGICIPMIDLRGRMSGIQIRRDGDIKPKYVWLSSKDKLNGCSSGVNIHVARPKNTDGKEIWITEGPLKADIASLELKRIFLAVPGVGNWQGICPIIEELNPQKVIVAFDTDKNSNSAVKIQSDALISYLVHTGIRTFEADWKNEFKGIDDLIHGDDKCRRS